MTPSSRRLLSYGRIVAGIVFGYGRPAAATMAYKYGVYLLPKQLDEKVAELHFPALGAALTVFAREHPSSFLPDVVVFHEPVLLQLDLLTYSNDTTAYKDEVYLFSKELDEEVAKLHIPALGAVLTVLIQI